MNIKLPNAEDGNEKGIIDISFLPLNKWTNMTVTMEPTGLGGNKAWKRTVRAYDVDTGKRIYFKRTYYD